MTNLMIPLYLVFFSELIEAVESSCLTGSSGFGDVVNRGIHVINRVADD